jgi:5'-nucleotidase / UDP-sugar diphosphatase
MDMTLLRPERRLPALAGVLALLGSTLGCSPEEPPKPREVAFTLQVLHASDQEAGLPATQDAPRFSAVLRALEEELPKHTLKLASGDLWLPGVFYNAGGDPALNSVASVGRASAGRADIALFNEMGFHAASFGNHEFDNGTREVRNILVAEGAWPGTRFPYLSANLDFSANSDLSSQVVAPSGLIDLANPTNAFHNRITSSVIFDVEGTKIGVVGATTPLLPSISAPGTVVTRPSNPTDYDALAAIIQPRVDELLASGVDKVILMAHMQQYTIEVNELPRRLDHVDVIIAGGNHSVWADDTDTLRAEDTRVLEYPQWKTSRSGQPVAVLNVGSNWRYVGRFLAPFDAAGVLVPEAYEAQRGGAYATDDAGVQRLNASSKVDPEVQAVANGIRGVVEAKDGRILGRTQVYLNGLRASVRTQETNLGTLTADANLWAAQQVDASVVISLKNGGGIRDSIGTVSAGATPTYGPPAANPAANKQEGQISQLDIENSLRFNNDLALLTVTAAQLKEVFEHGVSGVAAGATPGAFPQVSGVRLEYDASRTAQALDTQSNLTRAGERVRRLVVLNAAGEVADTVVEAGALVGDPNRTFRLVTLGFLSTGGDSYPFARYQREDASRLNRVLLDTTTGNQGFDDAGREQKALVDYLQARFPPNGLGYAVADTPAAQDQRIRSVGP